MSSGSIDTCLDNEPADQPNRPILLPPVGRPRFIGCAKVNKAGLVALIVPLSLLTASCVISGDDVTPKRYTSPAAVFDAYRKARGNREWRKCFSLLTPNAQNDAVFEHFFFCTMSSSKEATAILKKYVDGAALNADYQERYKKKHGVDLARAVAGHENDPTFVPPPHDEQLWRDVVVAHIKDKARFIDAVASLSQKNAVSPLGDLEQLVVHDDTATGCAKMTIVPTPGESPLKPGQSPAVYEKPFKFRKVNGGWLHDSL